MHIVPCQHCIKLYVCTYLHDNNLEGGSFLIYFGSAPQLQTTPLPLLLLLLAVMTACGACAV